MNAYIVGIQRCAEWREMNSTFPLAVACARRDGGPGEPRRAGLRSKSSSSAARPETITGHTARLDVKGAGNVKACSVFLKL